MATHLSLERERDEPSLAFLIVKAIAFWFRNQAVFWLVALLTHAL